jgi:hypothetical protein
MLTNILRFTVLLKPYHHPDYLPISSDDPTHRQKRAAITIWSFLASKTALGLTYLIMWFTDPPGLFFSRNGEKNKMQNWGVFLWGVFKIP